MSDSLSDEVRAFIHTHIHSVEQLEVLLLLRRDRTRGFSGTEVASELRIHPASAEARLQDFEAREFCARTGDRFFYAPKTAELERLVGLLATAYGDARVTVIQTIFSKPPDALRSFADAFKLRGKS